MNQWYMSAAITALGCLAGCYSEDLSVPRPCESDGSCLPGHVCSHATVAAGVCVLVGDSGDDLLADSREGSKDGGDAGEDGGDAGEAGGGIGAGGGGGVSDPCAANNGGCSSDATCTSSGGSPSCVCQTGFIGDGGTCQWSVPSLTDLSITPGSLNFSPATVLYALEVPSMTSSVSVTPAAAQPTHTTVQVNGIGLERGSRAVALTSPTTELKVTVTAETGAQRTYVVVVVFPFVEQWRFEGPTSGEGFGSAMALSGDGSTLAIGAPNESGTSSGVNITPSDFDTSGSGAVYVFSRTSSTWTWQAYVKASNNHLFNAFGTSVALSIDGNTLAIGAQCEGTGFDYSGAAYVFRRSGTTWSQQKYLKAPNAAFSTYYGNSIALSGDGATLAVGAYGESSSARGVFSVAQTDTNASNAGAVYVYVSHGGSWPLEAYLKASNAEAWDNFSETALALDATGNTLAVGATGESSAATGVGGDEADNTASSSGAVYLFARTASRWTQQAYIKASNTGAGDSFGASVALASDGSTLAIGAPYEDSKASGVGGDQTDDSLRSAGAVYVFARSDVTWAQQAYVKATNPDQYDLFGRAVSLSGAGSTLLVGAPQESSSAIGVGGRQTDNSMPSAGAAYTYLRGGTRWTSDAYLKASSTRQDAYFGGGVAVDGDASALVVGPVFNGTGLGVATVFVASGSGDSGGW